MNLPFRTENLQFCAATVFSLVAAVGLFEHTHRAPSHITSFFVLMANGYDPTKQNDGFVANAQSHFSTFATCANITEEKALDKKLHGVVASCRAVNKHSLFFGPSMRELVKKEMPTADQPGNPWPTSAETKFGFLSFL